MSVFKSIPKDVVLKHIVSQLTYKQRIELYSTCRHFWSMKTNEYIYGDFVPLSQDGIFDIFYCLNMKKIAVLSHYPYAVTHRYVLRVYEGHKELYDNIERATRLYCDTFGPGLPGDLPPDSPVYHITKRPLTISYKTYMRPNRKKQRK